MARQRLYNAQPDIFQRVRVWRKGKPLLGVGWVCAVPGEWGSIVWADAETTAAPNLADEWEPAGEGD